MRLIDADALLKIGNYGSMLDVFQDWKKFSHETMDAVCRYARFVKALIENQPTVERWIPVSDEIPEQYHCVIGWTKFKEMGEVMHDGKQFVWTDEETVHAFVTHWMPLPEPPKEVE